MAHRTQVIRATKPSFIIKTKPTSEFHVLQSGAVNKLKDALIAPSMSGWPNIAGFIRGELLLFDFHSLVHSVLLNYLAFNVTV